MGYFIKFYGPKMLENTSILLPNSKHEEARKFFRKVYPEHTLYSIVENEAYGLGILNWDLDYEDIFEFPTYGTYVIIDGELISILY